MARCTLCDATTEHGCIKCGVSLCPSHHARVGLCAACAGSRRSSRALAIGIAVGVLVMLPLAALYAHSLVHAPPAVYRPYASRWNQLQGGPAHIYLLLAVVIPTWIALRVKDRWARREAERARIPVAIARA